MTAPSSDSSRSFSSSRSRGAPYGDDGDPAVRRSLDRAAEEALAALAELRDLALGIYPLILTESGLGEAVESLADRTSVDVSVDIGSERYSPVAEGAAYFVISEALTNVTKYAQATRAVVRVRALRDYLSIEVDDDGIGGADPRRQRATWTRRPPRRAQRDDHDRQPARWWRRGSRRRSRPINLGRTPCEPCSARTDQVARWAA